MPRVVLARGRNRGWFKRGFDRRRKRLTAEECSRGWHAALAAHPELYEWLILRAKGRPKHGRSETAVTIHSTGAGTCALTGKEESDGMTVSFDDKTVENAFLSWKAFRQLLALKTGTVGQPKKPEPKPADLVPAVLVGNGQAAK